jgi:hypothetical protein
MCTGRATKRATQGKCALYLKNNTSVYVGFKLSSKVVRYGSLTLLCMHTCTCTCACACHMHMSHICTCTHTPLKTKKVCVIKYVHVYGFMHT